MSSVHSAAAPPRWGGRPVQAALVRILVFAAPIGASIGFVDLASRAVPAPLGSLWVYLLWWFGLTAGATGVLVAVDRAARRLLPLAALLKLSLVFPDQTPSRFKTAMRAGSTKNLEARMQELRNGPASRADSAALLLELVAALNSHDRVTRGHSERVRAFAVLIGEELGLSPEELEMLNWSALLHDVGKLSVPSGILNKPGRPDEEEWQLLKAHPLFGETLVKPLRQWLGEWADAVGYHHERWDGAGYPRGVEGDDIPLPGRIVAVADVYDVITSARSYKEAGGAHEGREEISPLRGQPVRPAGCPRIPRRVPRTDAADHGAAFVALSRADPQPDPVRRGREAPSAVRSACSRLSLPAVLPRRRCTPPRPRRRRPSFVTLLRTPGPSSGYPAITVSHRAGLHLRLTRRLLPPRRPYRRRPRRRPPPPLPRRPRPRHPRRARPP